ncbi:hypothetical protein [Sorangium sp. So ce233]|uniref:hypothetical protein n=1 Tax=Sorangium sp. So ce233 TaxID=3133290 RepID=UPI003F5E8A3B
MKFELKITVPDVMSLIESGQAQYDPELDDLGSVLRDICETLEAAGVGFLVRVCSEAYWPVTVRTDLLVVVEQLGVVLASLAQDQVGKLDFYEQGIERVVSLVPKDGSLLVQCSDLVVKATSRTESVLVPREAVIKELIGLADGFLRVSRACCEQLASHPWFVEWATDLQRQVDELRQPKGGPIA